MFHVEQKKINIKVVDHFLTKETFVLSKTDIPGMLRTTPPPTQKQIGKYYKSKLYTSHNSSQKNTFSFLEQKESIVTTFSHMEIFYRHTRSVF